MDKLVNSNSARDVAYHMHPYTNLRVHEKQGPIVIVRGEGVKVFDEDGKEYIEGLAGLWCTSLGFSEQRLVDAAIREMKKLPYYHIFSSKASDVVAELAERLIKIAPVPMSKVFFANSGSEANDTVVKLVWYYNNAVGRPKKKKIIARKMGYHGVTVASASLTGIPANHIAFDLPIAGILHTDCPHYWKFGQAGESEEQFAGRCAQALEDMILKEGPDTVAAFIAEPVMGAGGVIVPPKTYFEKIQPILKKYDILFIADEVICGFGRTGNMWASQTYNLRPDIITFAKALSSAYLPISAVMITEPLYQAIADQSAKAGRFSHGFTYSGHPVSAAVALETQKIYEERDIVGMVKRVSPAFLKGLRKFAERPYVGEVRGVGLVGAFEFSADKATKKPFAPTVAIAEKMMGFMHKHGVIPRQSGDSICFSPPLIISEREIEEMYRRTTLAMDDLEQAIKENGWA